MIIFKYYTMKQILLYTFFFISLIANSQVTSIPDANFEQALIDFGYDTVIDGEVLTANISGVVSMDVNNRGIASLDGIQDFTSLVTLRCHNNALSSLNTGNLTNLEILWCFQNNLTALNLSNNLALRNLYCDQNSLTSLDLVANTALEELSCGFNQIDFIDVSGASSLIYLIARNNQLEGLNVQNGNNTNFFIYDSRFNTPLSCVQVDDVAYSSANWTNVDNAFVFNLNCHFNETFVPDDNFENALITLGYDTVLDDYVSNSNINTLTSLNVSLRNISDLTGVEGFTALQDLNCARNNLTNLDVSENENLVSLNCNRNALTSLAITDGSGTQQLNLIELQCGENNLMGLTTNFYPNLERLNCANNNITDLNALFLNVNLESLVCNNNAITSLSLNANTAITEVDLRDNQLTGLSIKNGSNTSIITFNALNNASLNCISVDDEMYSTTNWTNIDSQTVFSNDCSTLTNQNFEKIAIAVYPNPVQEVFTLKTNQQVKNVAIYNVQGSLVKSFSKTEDSYNLQDLNPGLYFAEIETSKGAITKKFIKE